jgi:hypothetical protein
MSNAFLWQQSRRESCGLNSEFGLGHRWTSEHEDSEVLVPNSEHQQSHCCNQRFGRGRAESALDKAFDVVNIRVSCARQVGARIGGLQGDELPGDAEFLRTYATTNKEPIFIMAFDWNQAHCSKWPRTLVSIRLGSRLRCTHRRSRMNMITVATDAGVCCRRMWMSALRRTTSLSSPTRARRAVRSERHRRRRRYR